MSRFSPLPPSVGLEVQVWGQKIRMELDAALDSITEQVSAIAAAQAAVRAVELSESYVSGLTISASDAGTSATVTISAHTRVYPQSDGSTITKDVGAGTLTGLAYSTAYYLYYDDEDRNGGPVAYQASTTTVAQTGPRHSVGAITTPAAAAAPTGGNVLQPRGYVEP